MARMCHPLVVGLDYTEISIRHHYRTIYCRAEWQQDLGKLALPYILDQVLLLLMAERGQHSTASRKLASSAEQQRPLSSAAYGRVVATLRGVEEASARLPVPPSSSAAYGRVVATLRRS
ncbi:PREDICTED: uncharacterized protein LOC109189577 [Ipomoea nil]|uniref:uncharacterized protein LOC109189577 n=1 Tax=Ipomoea nil TaxID=35883 RepID=UPI000901A53B|nr:PREDICTED: uncharacterized protein LOC109189577 [Ipomoea nil]